MNTRKLETMNMNMETRSSSFLCRMLWLLIISWLSPTSSEDIPMPVIKFDSGSFPDEFMWGTATAAYQTEGAANQGHRGPSIWDTFTHEYPERIQDGSNGDIADEFYYKYADDIKKMNAKLGMNAFRFSISWSRVIPSGRRSDGVNEEGIEFYQNVINQSLSNGLEPFITIFHWDLPQALEDKYGGFLSRDIIYDFKDYTELLFERFGQVVKYWITFNEPYIFITNGYDSGDYPPSRCSSWVSRTCNDGDSATEPYIAAHNILLAHAEAVQSYRSMNLIGEIGITLDITWAEAISSSIEDRSAAHRDLEFAFGWFMDPLTYGRYPRIMRALVKDRLPTFTRRESRLVKKSYDFVGINYYTSTYASANFTPDPDPAHIRCSTDSHVNLTKYKYGRPIGLQATPDWLYIVPEGIRYTLNYTKDAYQNPAIYITENGIGDNEKFTLEEARLDVWRIKYHERHLWNVLRSICDYGVNVKGYFAWSFMDNFEWTNGYTVRMGLYSVDRNNSLIRRPKLSVAWFKEFLANKGSRGLKCNQIFEEGSLEDLEEL